MNHVSKYPREAEIMERALRLRAEAMATKISRLLAGRAVNLGFATVYGVNGFGAVNYGSDNDITLPALGQSYAA